MNECIRTLEIEFIKLLRNNSNAFWDIIMQCITILGEQYFLILGLAIVYFIYDKKIGQIVAYTVFTSMLLNNSLKGLVKYERPFTYDPEINAVRKETATGFSFPSGHTQNAATIYPAIVHNCNFSKKWKKILWPIVVIIVSLIGFSRIFIGVHYPKDVIVGMALGYGATFLCPLIVKKCKDDYIKNLITLLITLTIFTPFIFIFYKSDYNEIEIYKDFYKCYGLVVGYISAFIIDNKLVNYTCNTILKKKLIRFFSVIICFLIIEFGLKYLFSLINNQSIYLDTFRYFLLSFIPLGILPLVFKNNLFKD